MCNITDMDTLIHFWSVALPFCTGPYVKTYHTWNFKQIQMYGYHTIWSVILCNKMSFRTASNKMQPSFEAHKHESCAVVTHLSMAVSHFSKPLKWKRSSEQKSSTPKPGLQIKLTGNQIPTYHRSHCERAVILFTSERMSSFRAFGFAAATIMPTIHSLNLYHSFSSNSVPVNVSIVVGRGGQGVVTPQDRRKTNWNKLVCYDGEYIARIFQRLLDILIRHIPV